MARFGGPAIFAAVAGTPLCGKDGIPKLLWLKRHEPDIYRRMDCFLDVGGYLLWRCTGRMAMELSGAGVFGLDLKRKTWLTGIMRYAGLDTAKLPPLVRSTDVVGRLTREAAAALRLLHALQAVLRLSTSDRFDPAAAPEGLRRALLAAARRALPDEPLPDFAALERRLVESEAVARQLFDQLCPPGGAVE